MKRSLLTTALTLVLVLSGTAVALPSGSNGDVVWLDPDIAGVISSDNVTYHGTIPIDSPGVGGEVVVREDLDGTRYFYATGAKGLSIYDVTDPPQPQLVGHLPFPHSQNEDLKVSEDGRRAVIAADGGLLVVNPATTGIHVIDTTDPTDPQLIGSTNAAVRGDGVSTGIAEHTAECADAECNVIYGRTGRIYDAADPGAIEVVGDWRAYEGPDGAVADTTGIHALNRDPSGLVISDSNPRLVLDPADILGQGGTPTEPTVLAIGFRDLVGDNVLQHNNRRTDPLDWAPRDPDDPADEVELVDIESDGRSIDLTDGRRPLMRAGELMIGNSETNLNRNCNNAGGLSTWSMVNFDQGAQLEQLEVFRPLNGTYAEGSPPANALGCSGHWFTVSGDYVAASWYEHGVRFFEVDKAVGTITEVGFFQSLVTQAGASYWIDDEFVYNVDYARGIDIVSFDRQAPRPSTDELVASWLAGLGTTESLSAGERAFCRLATLD